MKITNAHDLPEPYWRACAVQRRREAYRISVTELLQPAQMRGLLIQHGQALEEDCADRVWAFFGTAVHEYLARFAETGAEAEVVREWSDPETGWVVHGTPDYFFGRDGWLTDWKTTTVKALEYDREEWEQQLNLYRWLLAMDGHNVIGVQVWALLRDYEPGKRHTDEGYPSAPLVRVPVRMWPQAETADFLGRRLRLHQLAAGGTWGDCSDGERWKRDTYAVVPTGGGKAVRGGVWKTKDEARAARAALDLEETHVVETRPGQPVRCQSYCPVRTVCPQWAAEQPPTLLEELEASVKRLIEVRG